MLSYRDIIKLKFPTKNPIKFIDSTYAGIVWNPLDFTPNPTQVELDNLIATIGQNTVTIGLGVNELIPSEALLEVHDFAMSGNLIVGGLIGTSSSVTSFSGNAITVPSGTTANQPTAIVGGIRYNTDTQLIEFAEEYPAGVSWGNHVQVDSIVDAGLLTGFVNQTDSVFTCNNTSRTFTISPTAGDYEIYVHGVRTLITTVNSVVFPDNGGIYYFYYDANASLQYSSTPLVKGQLPIAWLYWSVGQQQAIILADKRRGLNMPYATATYLTKTFGPIVSHGLKVQSYNLAGTGNANSDAQVSITNGTLLDADITIDITHAPTPAANFQQVLNGPAEIPVYYLSGTGAGTEFLKDTATTYPVKQGVSRLQYNSNTLGAWGTTDVTEGYFVTTFIVSSSSLSEPIFALIDTNEYPTADQARANSLWTNYAVTTGLGTMVENIRPLYALVYQSSSSYTNTPRARLVDIASLHQIGPSGTQLDHSYLGGLLDDDHLHYVHESNPRTISATHTFSPTVTGPAFILGSTAQGQLIPGLNADTIDGIHSNELQLVNPGLTALSNTSLTSVGLYTITSAGTGTTRELYSPSNSVVITNPGGVSGNITIDLANVLTPVSNIFTKFSADEHGSVTYTTPVLAGDITSTLGYTPLNKAGDTLLGNLNLGGYKITNLATPTTTSDAATKSYVDGIATGLVWLSPVDEANLIGNVSVVPTSPTNTDSYIIDSGGNTGAWSTFAVGDIVQYQTNTWVLVKPVTIGDRFGIGLDSSTTPVGAFTSYKNYVVTVVSGSAGNWVYSYTSPTNNNALYVSNNTSIKYGTSLTYSTSLTQWVTFSSSVQTQAGDGVYFTGTTLNVGTANTSRIVVNPDSIDLATTGVTANTYSKLTVDAYGRVTLGANIATGDVTTALGYTPQPVSSNLTALANTSFPGIYIVTGTGTSTLRSITVPAGMSITNADGVAGNITLGLSGELAAVQGLSSNGLAVRTGTGAWTTRSIVVPSGMLISNADGILANPTISLTNNLASISGLTSTGIVASDSANSFATRSFTGQSSQISVTNGDLIAGNGTIALANNPIIPGTASLTLPVGTTAQLPVTPAVGMLRYNSTNQKPEVYDGIWANIATEHYISSTISNNITLTGDITATGTTGGSVSTTLATVNANVGTFAVTTVNSKGLATSATNLSINGDATGTSAGSALTLSLAAVNTNIGVWGDSSHVPQLIVNAKGLVTAAGNVLITPSAIGAAPLASAPLTGTPTAPTAAANTNTTQLATTAFVVGQAGTAAPLGDNIATVGTSLRYAREDHVHPKAVVGAGTPLQVVSATVAAVSGTTTVALNNTTPTTATGTLISTIVITPGATTSQVRISGSIMADSNNSSRGIYLFVFRGTTCVGVASVSSGTSGTPTALAFNFVDSPASNTAVTYTFRVASNSSTWYINQSSQGARFGGLYANNAISLTELS